ncbi:MAG TPA: DinB family protein, partial [Pyrinomonadaceae bacterium]
MQIVRSLDENFTRLHERTAALVRAVPADKLYWQPRASAGAFPVYSCGEHVLRSAAAVEQTFGGITVNLWDDPFEWTLPETLATPPQVIEYLGEAEATRRRAFALFKQDADLTREIAAPEGMRTLFSLVAETLVRAAHHEGRAYATFRLFSD